MNLKLKRTLVIISFLICFTATLRSQIIYSYDASGNPTNSVLSSATALTSSATNSTPIVTLGDDFSLSATAAGSGTITYQWLFNGVAINGATNATYFVPNSATTNAGAYSVVVSNGSTSQTNQVGNVAVMGTTNTLYAVAYGLNQFIAVGTNGTVVGSSNLVYWLSFSSSTTNTLNGIVFGNNAFVAVGAAGTIVTSTNGSTWTMQSSGSTNNLNAVTIGNNLFVAVGNGGTTMTSPDGTNWTQQTFDNATLEGVTYAANHFVAVGTGGTIWTSPNGTNWAAQNCPVSSTLSSVCYGNNTFVAVATDGSILNSPDSTNWTLEVAGPAQGFNSVLFFNHTFYAIGAIGMNLISSDGVNWGASASGTMTPLFGSTVGNNISVAVGASGWVAQIPTYQLDHFAWNAIPSPQRTGATFATTITAQDGAGNTVSNFNGTVSLSALSGMSSSTNNIIGTMVPAYTNTGSATLGYSFTPNANLLVTQVRHYDIAQQVSIWDENSGALLATIYVTNNPGQWASNPLSVPLTLTAGESYLVTVYTGDNTNASYYYREDGPNTFPNGTIDQAFGGATNAFPLTPQTAFWYLVDLGYTVQDSQSNSVSPTTVNFANGVATPSVTLTNAGQSMVLTAFDNLGHAGTSAPFSIYGTNDLAVTLAASAGVIGIQSNLTYTIAVMNTGPSSATGVNVTNVLPANVSLVSASSTQGTCLSSGGQVTCSVGTLTNQAIATISIVVTPTVAGIMLTDTVSVAESGADSNLSDNTATNLAYVPPTLSIGNVTVSETTTGITYAKIPITLSSASVLSINFNIATMDGTNAIAGRDYVPYIGSGTFPAGSTNTLASVSIGIQGSPLVSPTKTFTVQLSSPVNATLSNSVGTVSILNTNGHPGQIYNLAWITVPSPERTNTSFSVGIIAKDANGNTATNFSGTVGLTGINVGGPTASTLLPSPAPVNSANNAIMTVGYAFTPTNNIYVTDVRSFAGSKVSIWTATGFLLASQSVSSVPGTWVDTPLTTPVWLSAGNTYVIGAFTAGGTYYWREDGAMSFPDGLISQGYSCGGDSFPTNFDGAQWYLVDLRYVRAASISPTSTGNFIFGIWSGNMTVNELGTNVILMANDNNGHVGFSNPFGVYATNDLAVTIGVSPVPPIAQSNLVYTVTALNPGPNSAVGVLLTNTLPTGATFVSAVASQGTCSQSGGLVTANLGTIPALSNATITITVWPTVAGLALTNTATITDGQPDPNLTNNSTISVVTPSFALTAQLGGVLNYSNTPWLSGGNTLWGIETNTTHDGTSAAQSGTIVDSQQSWIQTTVYGPGTLSFWWSVSSQAGGDYLNFLTNGVLVTNISGNVGWQQVTFAVPPGHTSLTWSYNKDSSISSGSDAGWLDQVIFNPTTLVLNTPRVDSNGNFIFTLNGVAGQILIFQSSTNLTQWQSLVTNTMTGGTFNYTNSSITNYPALFFHTLDVTP